MNFFFDGVKCYFVVDHVTNDELQSLPTVVLTDDKVPYDPIVRLSTRRANIKRTPNELLLWKAQLGFVPYHVVTKTLSSTTQLVNTVEAETREILHDHFQSRFPQLRYRLC